MNRPFDFNRGDRRFFDLAEALGFANKKARLTGVRQRVRPDSKPHFVSHLYVVQDIR